MKRDRNLTCIWGAVLAFMLSFGALGAMVTGLRLDVESFGRLALLCALVSAGSAFCFRLRRGGTILLCVLAAAAGYLWRQGELGIQTLALLYRVCSLYDGAYGWGIPEFTRIYRGNFVDLPLAVIGTFVAVVISRTVCRQKRCGFGILAAVLPLVCCFVVTDTVPDTKYIYIWILALVVLLLSNGVRRQDLSQGLQLTAMTAAAGAAALGLLFMAVPRETYNNHPQELQDKVIAWVQALPVLWEDTSDTILSNLDGSVQPSELNLRAVGPKVKKVYPVMDVNAPQSGTLYLRGQDYDVYDGTGWSASWRRSEELRENVLSSFVGEVHIQTRRVRDVLYVPYYTSTGVSLVGGRVDNAENVKVYSFSQRVMPENWKRTVSAMGAVPGEDGEVHFTTGAAIGFENTQRYLTLPQTTGAWAKALVEEILTDEPTATAVADAIANYVRSCAVYDLDTPKMSSDYDDFARWFLAESDTGYCVHFATATTVLLRAAGVEARYVEGYMTTAVAGEEVTVTADQAHAWAEYYEPLLDAWIIVESTPGGLTEEETQPVAETQTDPATEPEVTEDTLPGEEEQPTLPQRETDSEASQQESPRISLPDWLVNGMKRLVTLLLLAAVIHGQRLLRLKLRRDRRRRGSPNARALSRWREVELLYRLLKDAPPSDMESLAQKAKYSQHSISSDEMKRLDDCIHAARERLQARPWYQKWIDQYVFAAY